MFENIMRGITHALCEYGMWHTKPGACEKRPVLVRGV